MGDAEGGANNNLQSQSGRWCGSANVQFAGVLGGTPGAPGRKMPGSGLNGANGGAGNALRWRGEVEGPLDRWGEDRCGLGWVTVRLQGPAT